MLGSQCASSFKGTMTDACLWSWTHCALCLPSICHLTISGGKQTNVRDRWNMSSMHCNKLYCIKMLAVCKTASRGREPQCHFVDWLRTGEAAVIILSNCRRTERQKSESLCLLPTGKISVTFQVSLVSAWVPHALSSGAAASRHSGTRAVPFKNSCCV